MVWTLLRAFLTRNNAEQMSGAAVNRGKKRCLFEEVRPNQNKLSCKLLINCFRALVVLHLQPMLFSLGIHMRLSEEGHKCKTTKYLWSDLRHISKIRFHRNKFPFKWELPTSFKSINSLRLTPPLLLNLQFFS